MRPEDSVKVPLTGQELPKTAPKPAPSTPSPLEQAGIQQIGPHKALSDYSITDKTRFYGQLPGGTPSSEQFLDLFSERHTLEALGWWEKAVKRAFDVTSALTISEEDMKKFFKSDKGFYSLGIHEIVGDLEQKGVLVSKRKFFQLPEEKMGFFAYLNSFIWTAKKDTSKEEYLYLPNIKAACDKLLEWIDQHPDPLDRVMSMEELKTLCPENPDLMLRYLQGTLQRAVNLEHGIALLSEAGPLSPQELQNAQSLLQLKQTQAQVTSRITELEKKARELTQKAQTEGTAGKRQAALNTLKLKRAIVQQKVNAEAQLQNLQAMVMQLDMAAFTPKIIQGMRMGAEVMKDQNKELSVEEADQIMLDVKEELEKQAEIERALAGERDEAEEIELEKELAALGNEPKPPGEGGDVAQEDERLLQELEELTVTDEDTPPEQAPRTKEKL